MKKLKIILFIITILLCGVFLFATCKKTKAYNSNLDYIFNVSYIDDTKSGLVCIYNPTSLANGTITRMFINDGQENFEIYFNKDNNGYLSLYASGTYDQYIDRMSVTVPTNTCYYYFILGSTYDNDVIFSIEYGFIIYNGSNFIKTGKFYYFDSLPYLSDVMNGAYTIQTENGIRVFGYRDYAGLNYLCNVFVYDVLEYSSVFSEYADDVYNDYITPLLSVTFTNSYTAGYNAGYNFGYQEGYDDGYTAGQTAGYNSGYNAGYNAGLNDNTTAYNRGYDDGLADGYRDGVVAGYDNGYATGYDVGFSEGQAGATPVSKTIGIVSSIFAGIGEVLAVELIPGFTLGILILVPLFFGVLGLILWIWRRN